LPVSLTAEAARAASIAFGFSGTLAQMLGGGASVTANLTVDEAVPGRFQGSMVAPFATSTEGKQFRLRRRQNNRPVPGLLPQRHGLGHTCDRAESAHGALRSAEAVHPVALPREVFSAA
jgi:hypothetical protein